MDQAYLSLEKQMKHSKAERKAENIEIDK